MIDWSETNSSIDWSESDNILTRPQVRSSVYSSERTKILSKIDKRQGYNWAWTIVKFSLEILRIVSVLYSQQPEPKENNGRRCLKTDHYSDQDKTAGSKHPIAAGFWTGTTKSAVARVSYHCRFLQTDSILQLHCRSFTQSGRVQFHQHCRFMRPPGSVTWNITVGLCL